MKKHLLIYLSSICFAFLSKAQTNLVINPSFEDTVSCPNNVGQLNRAFNWDSYANNPEYFNSCSPSFSLGVSVPYNFGGYQLAATGNAYVGFTSFGGINASPPNFREFVGGNLTAALIIGTKYYVSFKVSLSIKSSSNLNLSSNNIGAKFSVTSYSVMNPMLITNSATIYSTTLITDSLNWTRISGSFIADSTYTHIILGNFFDDANTDTLIMDGSGSWKYAYYYLDDVCVSTDSLACNNSVGMEVYKKTIQNIKLYPNPSNGELFISCSDAPFLNIEGYDLSGRLLLKQKISTEKGIGKLNTGLENGLYILKVYNSVTQECTNKEIIINK